MEEAVTRFAAAQARDAYDDVLYSPEGALGRQLAEVEKTSLARFGIVRSPSTVLEPATWQIPAGAEDVAPGTVVPVAYRCVVRPEASQVAPGSLAATSPSEQLAALVTQQGKPITYAGISFLKQADGSWAKVGELAEGGTVWSEARICYHGSPLGMAQDGLSARVIKSTSLGAKTLHHLHIVNGGAQDLIVNTHRWPGPHAEEGVHVPGGLDGFPLPAGFDVVVPLALPREESWSTVGAMVPGPPTAALLPVPLHRLAGHPGGDRSCSGAHFADVTWLDAAAARARQQADLPPGPDKGGRLSRLRGR